METIKAYKKSDCSFLGIVVVKEWFGEKSKSIHSIYNNYFVVGVWCQYDNGDLPPTIEGQTTIAICQIC